MNPELVLKFMAQDHPWAFGLRQAVEESNELRGQAPLKEAPFFASVGTPTGQFRVIGDDLEECLQVCLDRNPHIQTPPE